MYWIQASIGRRKKTRMVRAGLNDGSVYFAAELLSLTTFNFKKLHQAARSLRCVCVLLFCDKPPPDVG